ncbi:MAG: SAM-dependent methyltransferase [Desulfobacca sp.]|nr:SAM-dependent methyltransferase [Desulfobacca sp.]
MNSSCPENPVLVNPDETLDSWGKGVIRIIQKKTGYRFSIDSLILFDFIRLKDRSRILDLGTGSGILALLLAKAYPLSRITALELSSEFLDLAHRNILLNKLQDQISLIQGDLCQLPHFLKKESFNTIVSNPPYRPLQSGRINPNSQKAMARHEIRVTLPKLLQAVAHGLKGKGKWFVIYPAWRLVSLLTLSRVHKLEPKKIQLVHSFPGKEAEWVLMEAVYQGREELKILPPLTVYQEPGVYSLQVQKSRIFQNTIPST